MPAAKPVRLAVVHPAARPPGVGPRPEARPRQAAEREPEAPVALALRAAGVPRVVSRTCDGRIGKASNLREALKR